MNLIINILKGLSPLVTSLPIGFKYQPCLFAAYLVMSMIGIIGISLYAKLSYKYYYLQQNNDYKLFSQVENFNNVDQDLRKNTFNNLDNAKHYNAYNSLNIIARDLNLDELEKARLYKINDYVFQFYKDFWMVQQKWFLENGRYFQGKKTTKSIPSYVKDEKVDLGFGLTDQLDNWRSIGYIDEHTPIQLECHVYNGPKGHGYTIFARFKIREKTICNQMHYGSETYRGKDDFLWIVS